MNFFKLFFSNHQSTSLHQIQWQWIPLVNSSQIQMVPTLLWADLQNVYLQRSVKYMLITVSICDNPIVAGVMPLQVKRLLFKKEYEFSMDFFPLCHPSKAMIETFFSLAFLPSISGLYLRIWMILAKMRNQKIKNTEYNALFQIVELFHTGTKNDLSEKQLCVGHGSL